MIWGRLRHAWSRLPATFYVAAPLLACAAVLLLLSLRLPELQDAFVADNPELGAALKAQGILDWLSSAPTIAQALAGVLLLGGAAALRKSRLSLRIARAVYAVVYLAFLYYSVLTLSIAGVVKSSGQTVDGFEPTALRMFGWQCKYLLPAVALVLLAGRCHLNTFRRRIENLYTGGESDAPARGDLLIEKINGWLFNPRSRSVGMSVSLHTALLFSPFLLQLFTSVTPYLIPGGRGTPNAGSRKPKSAAQQKKPRANRIAMKLKGRDARKLKGVIFSPNAGLTANLDRSAGELMDELDRMTSDTYQATQATGTGPGSGPGGFGSGGVGPGGFLNGVEGGMVRFIRIEYRGEKWDDGMRDGRSDANFLEAFKRETGLKTAADSESITIRQLKAFPKGRAPPFLFMTGDGSINVPPVDIAILRNYLLEGGLLFADCGSPGWHRAFRELMSQVFPDKPFLVLSDDDVIFQAPFVFPNGAPPLWHHGGNKAMGVKHNGRLVVFYHPGDLHDAWKTGHGGISAELTEHSFQTGINVIYYAFIQYLQAQQQNAKK